MKAGIESVLLESAKQEAKSLRNQLARVERVIALLQDNTPVRTVGAEPKRKVRTWTAKQKAEAAAKMKARWAERRKNAKAQTKKPHAQ